MLYVNVEAVVGRRPEVVWDVLTDIPAAISWVEGLVEAKAIDDDEPIGVGKSIHLRRQTEKKKSSSIAKANAEITVWQPPSLLVIETRAPDLLLLDRVSLAPSPEGTLIKISSEMLYGNKLFEMLTRRTGILLGSAEPHPVDGIYERSIQALIKRVEMISAAPFR